MDLLAVAMVSNYLLLALVFPQVAGGVSSDGIGFAFDGFQSAKLDLDGIASFTPNGLLRLTNESSTNLIGHAFYPEPMISIRSPAGEDSAFSFSTTFAMAIVPKIPNMATLGFAFVAARHKDFSGATARNLGIFGNSPYKKSNATDRLFAVEFDTLQSPEDSDINDNHVGIDFDGMVSACSAPTSYFPDDGAGKSFKNLSLNGGQAMQVWVDYNGTEKQITVTLAPLGAARPSTPLLSLGRDLSPIFNGTMYVGFSAATGNKLLTSHYILGWSFQMNGPAPELALSKLPKLPRIRKMPASKLSTIGLPILCLFCALVLISGSVYAIRRSLRFAEVLEEWELSYGPQRFKFKDLYAATRGFRDEELLGVGGFGKVYKGMLPDSKMEVAVKKISHDSRQGIREFVAEIASLGRLRHRNLVSLLGYCRRKGELLLVYDYMPNGSLDKYLFNKPKVTLNWDQRFRIIKGVASGLLYLHEGWDQVVIHRDVKASNVLLDAELNGRLGDFGLARLYDHGTDPHTTHVVGTLGYLAPENYRTSRATKATDVFAFGAFLLEVATGKRPVEARATEDVILVDWVYSCWGKRRDILEARDPNLGAEFQAKEVELVLKLGVLCSNPEPESRPTMQQVVQYLEGDLPMLDPPSSLSSPLRFKHQEGFDDFAMSYPSSADNAFSISSATVTDTILSGGR